MRLIDADALMENAFEVHTKEFGTILVVGEDAINAQPTAYDPYAVVKKLEEKTEFLKDCTKYGNESAEQQEKSYSTMMMYEVADLVDDLIDIVRNADKAV